jgi:S-DNA-T family DNA segregation ATPase FtsK/SpoIIIE
VAILTLLSLMSINQGRVTDWWLNWLRRGFGWGAYVMPIVFGTVGLGLLMYGFGRLPSVRGERVIGLFLVFIMALGLTHLIATGGGTGAVHAGERSSMAWAVVQDGRAGGFVGWAIGRGLEYAIGRIGGYVVSAAVLMIGLVLFVGLSTAEIGMAAWVAWQGVVGQFRGRRAPRLRGRELLGDEDYADELEEDEAAPYASRRVKAARVAAQGDARAASGMGAKATPGRRAGARVIGAEREKPAPASPPPAEPAQKAPAMTASLKPPPSKASWRLPQPTALLDDWGQQELSQQEIQGRVQTIERTLESFGVPARVVEVNQGPVVTQFGIEPGFVTGRGGKQTKVKVSKISSLADDLALALAASPIRIEAPVPGRAIVGLEVPNQEVSIVSLRGVMESEAFERLSKKTLLPIALGENVSGEAIVANLSVMPHLLIAGATGSGKSVCINAIISCLLCVNTPENLRMIMIDPKRVELTGYNGIPHLLAPVIVDLERVVGTLQWVTREMEQRYKRFAKVGARNIVDYNRRVVAGGQDRMPYIVVFIDELADLMMIAPDEVERSICRIAQMARATGIHLIIATQRPSVDVVTGLIKANFPARISFMVTSSVDSRVIIDTVGAERLLGSGDMLFMSPDAAGMMRVQGCWVSEPELERLIGYWRDQVDKQEAPSVPGKSFVQNTLPAFSPPEEEKESTPLPGQGDELIGKAIEVVRAEGRASTTLLQRRLRIGYARASRIIDALEEQGLIGPDLGGSRGREVLIADGP